MTFKEMQAEARKIRVQRGSVAALEYIQAWFVAKRAAEKLTPVS